MASDSNKDSPTPPPPDSSSPKSPPPPSKDNSSPPPPPSSPPPPPPPPSDDKKSPPPPSSGTHHPPHNHDVSPPPPPHHRLSPPKSHSHASGESGSNSFSMPLIIGIAAGVGILLLLLLLVIFSCSRRKKRSQTPVYLANHPTDDGYYKRPAAAAAGVGGPNQYGFNRGGEHVVNIPTSPRGGGAGAGAGWGAAPQRMSSDLSNSSYSGPVLPPPHPSVALGFNQSSFTYEELSAATAAFSQRNLLGQGGFGYVHKGFLPNGKEIAVKSLKSTGGQGDREFQAEVDIISRVHHRHLVSLVGYCFSEAKKLLVYEFVPNKTLEYHLHGKGRPVMDWGTRLKIAIGSAKGLAYLHEDCHPRIIHRDIKGANILLENNFDAKVADFGLAKFNQDNNTHVSTRVMGTFGYMAPEYASTGKLTDKSDVFSFGIMLLELISGRLPVDYTGEDEDTLVDWARPLCKKAMEDGSFEELADARLEGKYNKQQMASMVSCAAACVRHSAKSRPRMSQIVRVLEGDVTVDVLNLDGLKPGPSAVLSSPSDEDSYGANMMKYRRKPVLDSGMVSSEYGATSEYGLNPSVSSSDQSTISGHANNSWRNY